ncbi:MAG TPA: hypothetical protein PLV68_02675, partial [Ilumatobacteraceae bacterium]|nr:hypothetical protein [Ilumatobacteraceae bacterium]
SNSPRSPITRQALVEAQQQVVDCLAARGWDASYVDDYTLSVKGRSGDDVDAQSVDVDACSSDAQAVIDEFARQQMPDQNTIDAALLTCLRSHGIPLDDLSGTVIEELSETHPDEMAICYAAALRP